MGSVVVEVLSRLRQKETQMKPEDIEFVRSQTSHNSPDIQRLLSLLIEAEAMREKAEFFKWYSESNQRYLVLQSFILLPYLTKEQQQHYDWSDADWIANQKKECGI